MVFVGAVFRLAAPRVVGFSDDRNVIRIEFLLRAADHPADVGRDSAALQ